MTFAIDLWNSARLALGVALGLIVIVFAAAVLVGLAIQRAGRDL